MALQLTSILTNTAEHIGLGQVFMKLTGKPVIGSSMLINAGSQRLSDVSYDDQQSTGWGQCSLSCASYLLALANLRALVVLLFYSCGGALLP